MYEFIIIKLAWFILRANTIKLERNKNEEDDSDKRNDIADHLVDEDPL